MKILIFIEADVIVRHFIHSHVFKDLSEQHDVKFVFPQKGYKRIANIDPYKLDLPSELTCLTVHQKRLVYWKRLFQVSILRYKRGEHFRSLRKIHRWMIGWKYSLLYTVLGLPIIYRIFKLYTKTRLSHFPYVNLINLLNDEQPDLVMHPCVMEGVYINDLVYYTKAKQIPLVVIMNSWDNPSTKRSMVGKPDRLLVWGEQTKEHAIKYADMPPDRTIIFGAAQFDVYRKDARLTRDEFCRLNGISSKQKILLYAGSSSYSDETAHLDMLDSAIENGDLTEVSVLYRPHPWGGGGKNGNKILEKNWKHVFIESSMKGYLTDIAKGINKKYLSDYHVTHDVLSNIDAIVSPLSTILLEAALHGKPVMCFLPENEESRQFNLTSRFLHFSELFERPEIIVAHNLNEFISSVVNLMEHVNDDNHKEVMQNMCEYFVKSYKEPYGKRLLKYVNEFVVT